MVGTGIDDVLLVNPSGVDPASPDAVARCEAELGARLPEGYVDYVQRLGVGALGHFVRVAGPSSLPAATVEWRDRCRQYWFWDTDDAGVAPAALQERGVLLGDSFDGDELCFDPADPDWFFLLPANEDVARRIGPGFLNAVDWMLSGELNPWVERWTFESWTDRADLKQSLPGRSLGAVAQSVAALEPTFTVELDNRVTFFLPEVGGRASVRRVEDGCEADVTHDAAADPRMVGALLAALRGH